MVRWFSAIQTLELNRQDLKDRKEGLLWIHRSHLPGVHGRIAARCGIFAVFEVFVVRFSLC
jgi:hypothetical protein